MVLLLLPCKTKTNKTIETNRIKEKVHSINRPKPHVLDTLVLPEVLNSKADPEKVLSGGKPITSSPLAPSGEANAHKPFCEFFTYAFWSAQWTSTRSLEILCPVTSLQADSNLAMVLGSSWWESCSWQKLPHWWREVFPPMALFSLDQAWDHICS